MQVLPGHLHPLPNSKAPQSLYKFAFLWVEYVPAKATTEKMFQETTSDIQAAKLCS